MASSSPAAAGSGVDVSGSGGRRLVGSKNRASERGGHLNKLLGMLCFVRVVEHKSFTGAARSIGLSVPTVTKNVKKLENELGSQLLHRTTRQVSVTPFGEEFFNSCRRIFDELDAVETSIDATQKNTRGRVRLQCPTFFARVHLLPNLREFQTRYPQIEVEIHAGRELGNLTRASTDLAILVGDIVDPQFAVRTLARGPRVCGASPAYLEEYGTPQTIQDLDNHICLLGRAVTWKFTVNGRMIEIPLKGNLTIHGGDAQREAVLLGHGIAQLNLSLLQDDFQSGAVIEVLKNHRIPGNPVSVVYVPTRFMPKAQRVMIDFLVEIMSNHH
jgi:LysR family transcriptional regulator for bpeEF and oprC